MIGQDDSGDEDDDEAQYHGPMSMFDITSKNVKSNEAGEETVVESYRSGSNEVVKI